MSESDSRQHIIIRTSVIGILANIALAAFKAAAGLFSRSIAITLDAVNNLSDALSSVITILGARLAGKKADRDHPLGHGRYENLAAMVIAILVVYAGLTSLIESVKKIIHPETPDYRTLILVLVAVAVAVKLVLGHYVKTQGEKVHSDALIGSGEDARLDAVISASTLVAAGIFLLTGVSLEAWLGAAISIFILRSGFSMLGGTVSEILGRRVDADIAHEVKETIVSFPQISGAYDLILHSYGPDRLIGSVHVEVPEDMTALELDRLERELAARVYEKHHVVLAGVSVYAVNQHDPEAAQARERIRTITQAHPEVLQTHGFYFTDGVKQIRFDLILDFGCNREEVYGRIMKELQDAFPDSELCVTLDSDISD